jgi:peroxiredoxin Q/BCP
MMIDWRRLLSTAMLLFSGALQAAQPPQAGSFAPDFALPDAEGARRELAEWRGKWVVLYFYPKDNTPGCTREAINFRDNQPQLAALNAQVVGVSLDESASHRAFAEQQRLPFPLLADTGGEVSRRYGALSDWGVIRFAKRYTFLIDPEGRVAKTYLQVDAAGHAAEVITDLKALAAK